LVETGTKLLLPLEFSKRLGPIDVNGEVGYEFVPSATNGWVAGLAIRRRVSPRLELLGEIYGTGATSGPEHDRTVESLVLLLMAGRGLRQADPEFVGYFGLQFLFSRKRSASP
jgi:hypothetical protein